MCVAVAVAALQRRVPSGYTNEEYQIGYQGSAVSLAGTTPDPSVVADTNEWFMLYPEDVVNSQQGCRQSRFAGVPDKREKVLKSDPAWRIARKTAEDRRLELERQRAGEGGHFIPVLQSTSATDEEDEETRENPDDFPHLPPHQNDPSPYLNLTLASSGHAEQWQHVPGLTAVGRDWTSGAVMLKDPAISSGDQVVVTLVNHAFEIPVTIPPLFAEDFETVETGVKKSKRAPVATVTRAKVRCFC